MDEVALVERARRGDRGAFDQLVEAHLPQAWRVAFRTVRNEADAADVVQEAFLTAWKGLPEYRGEAAFGTWLHRIVVTRALNHLDRAAERTQRQAVRVDDPEVDLPPLADATPSPLAQLEARELQQRLKRCLERLPPDWRALLALREGEGHSYEELATITGLVLGTVRSRLARAREALKRCVEGGAR